MTVVYAFIIIIIKIIITNNITITTIIAISIIHYRTSLSSFLAG